MFRSDVLGEGPLVGEYRSEGKRNRPNDRRTPTERERSQDQIPEIQEQRAFRESIADGCGNEGPRFSHRSVNDHGAGVQRPDRVRDSDAEISRSRGHRCASARIADTSGAKYIIYDPLTTAANGTRNTGLKAIMDPMYGVGQLTLGIVLTEARCRVTFIHERHNPLS